MARTSVEKSDRKPAWRRRKDARQAEILQAARTILEERGYADATIGEVARLAGISEPTIYNYFDSKHELVHRVMSDWMEPVVKETESSLKNIFGVEKRLHFIAERHFTEMTKAPQLHILAYRDLRWRDYYESPFHHLNQRYTRLIDRIIQDGIADGEIRAGASPAMIRDIFFGGLEHIGWRTVLTGRKLDIPAAAEAVTHSLCVGILEASHVVTGMQSAITDVLHDAIARIGRISGTPPRS